MAHSLQPLCAALNGAWIARLRDAGVQVETIGRSVEGRILHGISCGPEGAPLVTVVAGAHPDEPAGPLAALALAQEWAHMPWAGTLRLAMVPLLDVDGVVAQRQWLAPWQEPLDLQRLMDHRLRRQPGADREFAWPGAPWSGGVLPECQAAAAFFDHQGSGPIAHMSLHGMLVAAGAWFLLNRPALSDAVLWQDLRGLAQEHGFALHDMPRNGDKGFRRVGNGFCTVPSGVAMRRWWCTQRLVTASEKACDPSASPGFAWGSMDYASALAQRHGMPEPLCAVSEFPLLSWPACHGRSLAWLREHLGEQLLRGDQLQSMPMQALVQAMLAMSKAVIAAALRRSRMRQ